MNTENYYFYKIQQNDESKVNLRPWVKRYSEIKPMASIINNKELNSMSKDLVNQKGLRFTVLSE